MGICYVKNKLTILIDQDKRNSSLFNNFKSVGQEYEGYYYNNAGIVEFANDIINEKNMMKTAESAVTVNKSICVQIFGK